MKEKVKIESINKVAQIGSIDVHANSVVCDLKLDVEKIVSASSDKFRDEESAKTNSYQKAKAEFGVDVIVDSSFVIRKTIEISTTGWIGIVLLILSPILFVVLDPPYSLMLVILCEIIGSICLIIGINRFYTSVISGYAGYYKNARNYYDQQKDNMLSTAKAVNNAFSETPSLNLEERKILDLIRQNNIKDSTLNTEQLQVWKKNKRIENKTDQTEVFYSVVYPNTNNFGTPSKGVVKRLKNRNPGSGNSSSIKKMIANFLKAAFLISILFFSSRHISKIYKANKIKNEMEQNELKSTSENLNSIIIDCEKAIKDMNPANIDSAKVASIKWSYKPDDYSDSVQKYDKIRSKIMIDFNKVIGKIKAEEKKKKLISLSEIENQPMDDGYIEDDENKYVENIEESNNDITSNDNQIYEATEQDAQFPGGKPSDFVSTHFNPDAVADVEGKIIVRFVVELDGSISNVEVTRGLSPEANREAIRVVRSMPRWKPGKNNGKAVRSRFNLPILIGG
jgi:hypothetical protein